MVYTLYYVHEPSKKLKNSWGPKSGQHINSPFSPYSVLTSTDILQGFSEECVTPCSDLEFGHLNVNSFMF